MSAKISASLYQTHISNHIILRELSKHKLRLNGLIVRLLELWRMTIRDVKVSLWNTSKVSGVFFVTSNYICYTICLYGQKNDLVTYNEFLTTNKKWEHPTANRKLPSLEKYYFILLISKGLYIKISLRVMALEISIYSKNETGQNSITLPD